MNGTKLLYQVIMQLVTLFLLKLLAHVASAEGITCVEKIKGMHVETIDYGNKPPGCTYCHPEIASVGLTEKQAKEKGYEIKVGKFPLSASGKATANGNGYRWFHQSNF
ncbi:MAG: hypothetical protein U0T78_04065 [Cloacibacterium normanense]